MNTLLEPIFSLRAYPNGAPTIEMAVQRAFNSAIQAVRTFRDRYGVMITPYDPGFWVDKSEKNIKYELSAPQTDIAGGNCVCTVGSPLARKIFGGGYLPSKRRIVANDQVQALAISTGMREPLYPSYEDFLQRLCRDLSISIYVYEYISRQYWQLDGQHKTEYTI